MTALLLLGPGTPMLFQGQEFGASTPFLFFADHNPELAPLVHKGRKEFLSQFPSIATEASQAAIDDPAKEATFSRCRLDCSERQKHEPIYRAAQRSDSPAARGARAWRRGTSGGSRDGAWRRGVFAALFGRR